MKKLLGGLGEKIKNKLPRIRRVEKPVSIGSNTSKNLKKMPNLLRLLLVIIISIAVILFSVEFIFAIAIYGFKTHDKISKAVASVVPYPAVFTASGVVTVSEYWHEKDYIEHFYASTKQANVDSQELSSQILRQEAENAILKKEAITFKLNISNNDVNDSMEQIYGNNGGQAEVEKALQDLYGLSVTEFKNLVKTQLLRDKINSQVIKHVTVRHILIRVDEGADQGKIDEAKTKIDGIKKEIEGGLSFADAANKYSEDVGSNQDGGLLESFARGDMVKEFEDVAFSSENGKVSEPFRTSFGWHILVAESTNGYIDQSFDDWTQKLIDSNYVLYLYKG